MNGDVLTKTLIHASDVGYAAGEIRSCEDGDNDIADSLEKSWKEIA